MEPQLCRCCCKTDNDSTKNMIVSYEHQRKLGAFVICFIISLSCHLTGQKKPQHTVHECKQSFVCFVVRCSTEFKITCMLIYSTTIWLQSSTAPQESIACMLLISFSLIELSPTWSPHDHSCLYSLDTVGA